jgi:DNA helicase HerA-like ATPase
MPTATLSITEIPTMSATTSQRKPEPTDASAFGRILSVRGSQASIGLSQDVPAEGDKVRATVGKFVAIASAASRLIGVITEVTFQTEPIAREQGYYATAHLDLMGEIIRDEKGIEHFRRGVTDYPAIGDPATLMSGGELRLVYDAADAATIDLGHLHQDSSVGAYVQIDDMLNKHFAVLGSTGVGKSSGVAVILQEILRARQNLSIMLIDPHNEYGRCFGDKAEVLSPGNLRLPFWLFNFDELLEVLFGGRASVEQEVEILSEVIPIAKSNYLQQRTTTLKKVDAKNTGYTVDTPVPYRLADVMALIDERMGRLENRSSRMHYHKLITRFESVRNDPRFAFIFDNANVGGDTMAEVLKQLFRIPPGERPITVMQLAGFPAEIVDSVVSVLCRMAFEFGLWSDGAFPLLFVCEEAHRYAPADHKMGFGPTRRSVARIAKEGRKYSVFLGLVTQRPAELDPTILSQCSTLFAMRMVNDRDQAILASAISDGAANLSAFVPSLGTREVLAFGEGVALPARLKFKELPAHLLPRSEALGKEGGDLTQDFIASVLERWRGAMMSGRPGTNGAVPPAVDQAPSIAPSHPALPEEIGGLRKPAVQRP